MQQGLWGWLEEATPTLVLAVVVLLGGVGYGVYSAYQAPVEPATAAPLSSGQ